MPPKRKVPARRVSTGKRVSFRIPLTPSGRPTRGVAVKTNYKETALAAKASFGPQADISDAPTTETPKKRGRPAKSTTPAKVATTSTPAKRASPKKTSTPKKTATPVKPARGRPKASSAAAEATQPVTGKRKRAAEDVAPEQPAKRRGRPAKTESVVTTAAKASHVKPAAKPKLAFKSTAPTKRIGRPPGAKNKTVAEKSAKPAGVKKATKAKTSTKAVKDSVEVEFDEGLTQPDEVDDGDEQYWLMKAEPDTRLEKGVDVSYPIDKLAAATEPEPWDGVRNAQARNNMRAMRKGDLAFFYHSNCDVPGIVGIMRIAEEHETDKSALDPNHPYFDPKSDPSKPKWDCVKVEFVKKFENIVSLKTVKETPELAGMQLAQKSFGRLSVQRVSPSSWKHVLKMAGEPEDVGAAAEKSGYEADTNGETDKDIAEDSVGLGDEDEVDTEAQKLAAYGGLDDPIEDDDEFEQDQRQLVEATQLDHSATNGLVARTPAIAA